MKLWIRVDACASRDPRVAEFADAIGVSIPTAIGHLVMLWGVMAEHTPDGMIGAVGVKALEQWAGWTGKRGRFAEAFHRTFVSDGEVNGWEKRQGALIRRMEKDRTRKQRGNSTETPANSAPTERNGTEQQTSSSPPAWRPIEEARLAERLTTDAGRQALAALLATADSKTGVVMALHALLDGMHPPRVLPEHLDAALIDYTANGMSNGRFNAKHFRHFTRRASEPPPTTPTTKQERIVAALAPIRGVSQ